MLCVHFVADVNGGTGGHRRGSVYVRKYDSFVLVNWPLDKAQDAADALRCLLLPHISLFLLDISARRHGHWVALLCD